MPLHPTCAAWATLGRAAVPVLISKLFLRAGAALAPGLICPGKKRNMRPRAAESVGCHAARRFQQGAMGMDDKGGRKLTAAQRRDLTNARWSADDLYEGYDADRLRGAAVILLLAVGIAAVAVFAVPALVWFL